MRVWAGLERFGCLIVVAALPTAGLAESWGEATSTNFQVVSQSGPARARRLAWHFERVRASFGATWPGARLGPRERVVVLAVHEDDTFSELLPTDWERARAERVAAAFVKGTERRYIILSGRGGDSLRVLQHEYVHLLLELNLPTVPLWLNEGLAEFYENLEVRSDAIIEGDVEERQLRALRGASLLSMETLLGVNKRSVQYSDPTRAPLFYAQSLGLVHYLLLNEAARAGQLESYLELLGAGENDLEAAREAFGDLGKLEVDLRAYLRRSWYPARRVETVAAPVDAELRVRELAPAEVLAILGEYHRQQDEIAQARSLIERALALDPGLGLAQATMGALCQREGRAAQAGVWLDRACVAMQVDACMRLADLLLGPEGGPEGRALAAAALERACGAGEVTSCARLGTLVELGIGVAPDRDRALELYGQACRAGDGSGCALLAEARQRSQVPRLAGRRSSAVVSGSQGPAEGPGSAAPRLGAADRHRLDCERGRAASCSLLGLMYASGREVSASPSLAAEWYRRGCNGGDAGGCTRLGKMLEMGAGREADFEGALGLYEKACEMGGAWGCARLGALYESARPVRALALYRKACEGGYEAACRHEAALESRFPSLRGTSRARP